MSGVRLRRTRGFNSRLREEATIAILIAPFFSRSFNSRLREEATQENDPADDNQ